MRGMASLVLLMLISISLDPYRVIVYRCDQMSLPQDFIKLFVLHVGPKEVVCERYG